MQICSVAPPPQLQQQQPGTKRKLESLELPPGNSSKDSTISAVKVQMSHWRRRRRRRRQVGRSDLLRQRCVRAEKPKTRQVVQTKRLLPSEHSVQDGAVCGSECEILFPSASGVDANGVRVSQQMGHMTRTRRTQFLSVSD